MLLLAETLLPGSSSALIAYFLMFGGNIRLWFMLT